MKVKIFSSSWERVQDAINDWFAQYTDIEIFKILQSESGGKINTNEDIKKGLLTISIFYKKKGKK